MGGVLLCDPRPFLLSWVTTLHILLGGGGVPVDPGEAMSKRGLSLVAVCVFAGSLPRAPKPMESQESGQGDQCVLI